jgi:hemolysin III
VRVKRAELGRASYDGGQRKGAAEMKVNGEARFSLGEEIANAVTHGVGALLSAAGLVLLVVLAAREGSAWKVVGASIYGASLFILYLASTLYHSLPHGKAKRVFQRLDYCAIYFLIAGSYTPFLLVSLRGALGWSLFGVVWALAICGIVLESVVRERIEKLSLTLYLLMGWMIVGASVQLFRQLAPGGTVLLISGGLFYTLGVIFYVWRSLRFHHAVWHGFVLGGSVCHYLTVYYFVIPSGR